MVKNGRGTSGSDRREVPDIERRRYFPPAPYKLDVEIVQMSDLRARVSQRHLQTVHRIEFHMLICVTRGTCTHIIDFQQVRCQPGTLLALRPSQVEQFDTECDWDGWLVLFRPEFLFSPEIATRPDDVNFANMLSRLPNYLMLQEREHRLIVTSIAQMFDDSTMRVFPATMNAMMRYQLCALLMRIDLVHRRQTVQEQASSPEVQRFSRFRQLVEHHFEKWHQVRDYASALGCSEKSIARATREVAGVSAKMFIVARINLEAKRLLAHTVSPVAAIADRLGFDEPTNFIKFFQRETGCTPTAFRRQQRARPDAGVTVDDGPHPP